MKRYARLLFVFVLVAALLPLHQVSADTPPTSPQCQELAAAYGATAEAGWIKGAEYCVLIPGSNKWNKDVVLFAHGYEDVTQPIGIPWVQLTGMGANLPQLILNLGYAFATTSYSKNGLAVTQGVGDIVNLVKYIRAHHQDSRRFFLTGASEGGLVTTLAVEKNPGLFAGGLATCGPIGDFQYQIQYWGDFRAAFDGLFPEVLQAPQAPFPLSLPPSTPIFINPFVVQYWNQALPSSPYPISTVVAGYLAQNQTRATQLIQNTGVPIDPANPVTTAGESIMGLLYYNVMATDDGRRTLVNNQSLTDVQLATTNVGNPYINAASGFQADPAALAAIQQYYQTSGILQRQLVIMHTTGDPIVPFKQSLLYFNKAVTNGSLSKVTLIPISRYGHCAFTPTEIVFGFYVMVLRSTFMPFSAQQIKQALPAEADQMEFQKLKNDFKEKTK